MHNSATEKIILESNETRVTKGCVPISAQAFNCSAQATGTFTELACSIHLRGIFCQFSANTIFSCLVPVRLSSRPSRSIRFCDVTKPDESQREAYELGKTFPCYIPRCSANKIVNQTYKERLFFRHTKTQEQLYI